MLSPQQEAVISWVKKAQAGLLTTRALILVARAGAGKTFTLMATTEVLEGEGFIGAYNKAIADEIKAKLVSKGLDPRRVNAGTLHSAGMIAWRRIARDVKVERDKVQLIIDALIADLVKKAQVADSFERAEKYRAKAATAKDLSSFVRKAVSLAKQRAFGFMHSYEDASKWFDLIDHFGLEDDLEFEADMEEAVRLCIHVFKTSVSQDRDLIDYDDMILAPLIHNARMWPKDFVLIDEAQDTNPARRALAIKMLKPKTGILIAVGDPAQAIYGFTGADSDAMDLIKQQLNSDTLPLNVTYRCPKAVVAVAQQWVPDITAHESAPEGLVRVIDETEFANECFRPEDAILCRNTKPLAELAFSLIRRGVACHVEGREIGNGLLQLARKWKIRTLNALSNKLRDYREKETQRFAAKGQEQKAAQVEDKVDTLNCLIAKLVADGKTDINDLTTLINELFTDGGRTLTLSTVHKSKGREWDRVYLLGRNAYMPSKWARKEWQQEQEANLCYVAVTRAKAELVEVIVTTIPKQEAA
jgi:superfamily I DNA/RNA helicase